VGTDRRPGGSQQILGCPAHGGDRPTVGAAGSARARAGTRPGATGHTAAASSPAGTDADRQATPPSTLA
jgi:hypothetical protein